MKETTVTHLWPPRIFWKKSYFLKTYFHPILILLEMFCKFCTVLHL